MLTTLWIMWITMWTMCKTFVPVEVFPFALPGILWNPAYISLKKPLSERTKGKIPCKNDEVLQAGYKKVSIHRPVYCPLCLGYKPSGQISTETPV